MKEIIIKNLYQPTPEMHHYDYSNLVEYELCKQIFGEKHLVEDSISEGYFPEWDIKLANGKTIEIKVQTSYDLFFETHQRSNVDSPWTPSGLSLSLADYWIMINPGKSRVDGQWEWFGKLRLFEALDIKNYCLDLEPNKHFECTKGYSVSARALNDVWIADLPLIRNESDKVVAYDIEDIHITHHGTRFLERMGY